MNFYDNIKKKKNQLFHCREINFSLTKKKKKTTISIHGDKFRQRIPTIRFRFDEKLIFSLPTSDQLNLPFPSSFQTLTFQPFAFSLSILSLHVFTFVLHSKESCYDILFQSLLKCASIYIK